MNVIVPICYIILFAYILFTSKFFKSAGLSYKILLGLFSVKLVSAFALHFLYTYYYTERQEADIFKYFDDSYILFQALGHSPIDFFKIFFGFDVLNPNLDVYFSHMNFWTRKINYGLFNDNQTIIRINTLVMLFSWGNIYVHHIFSAFISLFSFVMIYKVFNSVFPKNSIILIFTIFLLPSSLFWSSGMLKECIVMVGLGIVLYSMFKIWRNENLLKYSLYLLVGIGILLIIKLYVLLALLPALLTFFIVQKSYFTKIKKIYFISFLLCIALVICNQLFHVFPFFESIVAKRNSFIINTITNGSAGSYIEIGLIQANIKTIFIESPIAFFRACSLPYIWDVQKPIEFLPAIENVVLFIVIILAVFFYKKPIREQKQFILFSLYFSVILLWLVGLTTPVVGAIVRYKMPILPFLYTTFAMLIDWQKVLQIFKKQNGNNFI